MATAGGVLEGEGQQMVELALHQINLQQGRVDLLGGPYLLWIDSVGSALCSLCLDLACSLLYLKPLAAAINAVAGEFPSEQEGRIINHPPPTLPRQLAMVDQNPA